MKITGIDLHVLLVPDYDAQACSSAQDDLVVEIHTDEGIVGIGETDTNPWVARECIRARGTHCMGLGLQEMLLGADPMQPERVWETLYRGSKMTGRRGALICAMGAIDMALWDIKGKALGVPLHRLLGDGAPRAGHAVRLALADRPDARRIPRIAGREDRAGPGSWASGRRSWRSASTVPTATTACRRATTRSSRSSPSAARRSGPSSC